MNPSIVDFGYILFIFPLVIGWSLIFILRYFNLLVATIFIIAICNSAYAGISVCEGANGRINRFELRGNPIQGCFYYMAGQTITTQKDAQLRILHDTVPFRHLKMQGGFPTEMTQVEKDAVDAQLQAAWDAIILARRQQLGTRIANSVAGDFALTDIDTAIDNINNLAEAKVFLKKLVRGVIKLNEGNQ